MLTVTDDAAQQLAQLLDRVDAGANVAIRFVPTEGGWQMRLDQPGSEDETFDHGGRTILVLAPRAAEALENHTLEIGETEEGPALRLSQSRE